MKKQYTDKDLVDILAEVEVEFKKHLAPESKEVQLAKSEKVQTETSEYDDEDMAELETMYKSMNKTEAEAHYKTLKKAMFGEVEVEVKKSEVKDSTEEVKMLKSEVETAKAENDELKKSLEKLTQIVAKVFGKKTDAPKQKAITSMEVVKKSEEETKVESKDFSKISKEEITKSLTAKIRSGKIEKNDKEAINNFFINNSSIDSIKHLL
jgi:hypothetical protein